MTYDPKSTLQRHFLSPSIAPGFAVLLVLAFGVPRPLGAHSAPMTAADMVRRSSQIVVAVVTSYDIHWNERRNLILTDYKVVVEDRLKGNSPSELTITVIGGSLEGETQATCLTTPLEVGARYLMLLHSEARPTLSPFVGGPEGAIRDADGRATGVEPPAVDEAQGRTRQRATLPGVAFTALVEKFRSLACDLQDAREQEATFRVSTQVLPSKTYRDTHSPVGVQAIETPGPQKLGATPPQISEPADRVSSSSIRGVTPRLPRPNYFYPRRAGFPVAFNSFPPSFAPWYPNDQGMMSLWNVYGDAFRVYSAPTGTWSWGDGIFDLAGWPSEAQMVAAFGLGWPANILGFTFSRWTADGLIVESDIALNPAYTWTLDEDHATREDAIDWGFRQTMLHELGHSWGLSHPFDYQDPWWDSVMNYSPKAYRFATLSTDDANAMRSAFPGIGIHDGHLASYTTQDCVGCPAGSSNSPVYVGNAISPLTLEPGSRLDLVRPFKLENNGTDAIVNPVIDVYLTPFRLSWMGAIHVATWRYSIEIPTFYTQGLLGGSVSIPWGTPNGSYYVGLFYNDPADSNLTNNSAWTDYNVFLNVYNSVLSVGGIYPRSGPAAGGSSFALGGAGIQFGATVLVGGQPASTLSWSPTNLVLTAPALPPGTLNNVVVINRNFQSAALENAWMADFDDVPQDHIFHAAVERVTRAGITTGCGGGGYCADTTVNRASMAVFLLRGIHGRDFVPPAATGRVFPDVSTSTYLARWIEELGRLGITTGCGGGRFCPNEPITRAGMAVFLLKARHGATYRPPPASGAVFGDVSHSTFLADWIEQLATEGITTGCGGGAFCPNSFVSRGEMSVFIARAFGLP